LARLIRDVTRDDETAGVRVADGKIPVRPGVGRVIADALNAGWTVAVASTSAQESVQAVLRPAVGAATADRVSVFAGDVVAAKKPDPGIYLLALQRLGLDRAETLVVEDSRNGLLAATGAGLRCVITVNDHTRNEAFDEAVLVVSDLGDPGGPPIQVLATGDRPTRMPDHHRRSAGMPGHRPDPGVARDKHRARRAATGQHGGRCPP